MVHLDVLFGWFLRLVPWDSSPSNHQSKHRRVANQRRSLIDCANPVDQQKTRLVWLELLKIKHFKKYGLLSSRPFKLALGKEQFGAGYLDHNYGEKGAFGRFLSHHIFCRVLKGEWCSRGGGNWGTLRIPREDWGNSLWIPQILV